FEAKRTQRSRTLRLGRAVALGKRGIGLIEGASGLRIRGGQRLTHADLLRPLPWEHERDHAGFLVTAMASISCDTRAVKLAAAKRAAMTIAFSIALADERP